MNSKLKPSPDKRRHRERGMAIIMMALLLALFFVNYPGIPHEVKLDRNAFMRVQ